MEFASKNHKLKSGSTIKIKTPETTEAQNIINLKRSYIENTSIIPLTIDEYPDDLNHEIELIKAYKKSTNSILLVAEHRNKLIGNIDVTGSKRSKLSHTAMIGMGITEEWRNQGLGRILIESAINWAKNYSDLEIIWLDVYESNVLGTNLYKNTGFKVSGTIKSFFKDGNNFIDKIQMYQKIK